MADLSLPPPIDPTQTQAWMDAMRKQQMAQMLTSAMQQSNQTPENWDSMKVVPRHSPLQSVATLASALMAGKAMKDSQQATSAYYNPQPQQTQGAPAAAAAEGPPSPGAAPGAPAQGLLPQTQAPQNPLIPPGMTPQQAQALNLMGGREELVKAAIARAAPLDIQRQLQAAGIDPNSPMGRDYMQRHLMKENYTAPIAVKANETALDPESRQPFFTGPTAPEGGVSTTWGPNGPTQAAIPGAAAAAQAIQKAKTTGTQTATPIKLGTDENGKDIYGYPAPPGQGAPNATAPGSTASPGQVQSQKSGAEAGQTYAAELAKNATGATEVRRSLSELKNLSQQATPSAANESKAKLGAFMIAAGADPMNVAKWTGVDTGALQAAQKQTATLAVNSIHSMTSRGTNFDLDTFMRNNPNMNMADPAAFARVADYMNNKASQDIAKQKDFAQFKKGVAPEDWETAHTAHWLDLQNQAIDKGHSNSANPNAPGASLADLQAEARRRGLIK